jgi:hypothetical protein
MNTNKHTPGWYLPKKDPNISEITLLSTDKENQPNPFAMWIDEDWLGILEKSGVKIICN